MAIPDSISSERPAQVDGGPIQTPSPFESLAEAFLATCASGLGSLVFLDHDLEATEQSYDELRHDASCVLTGLRATGIQPGDPVLLSLHEPRQVLVTFWACQLGGFAPLILPELTDASPDGPGVAKYTHVRRLLDRPWTVSTPELVDVLAATVTADGDEPSGGVIGLEHLLTHEATAEYASRERADVALFVLTSGSTGMPKVIPHTNATLLDRATGVNEFLGTEPSDVCLVWLAFDHIGTISDWHLRPVLLANRIVHAPRDVLLGNITLMLDLADRYRVTHTWAPNFAYALINGDIKSGRVKADWNLESVIMLLSAGEAVLPSVVREFHRLLEPNGLAESAIAPAFGMAETGSGITYFSADSAHVGERILLVDRESLSSVVEIVDESHHDPVALSCLGDPIPGVAIRIVDDDDRVVGEHQVGHLQVTGRAVFAGYHAAPDVNAEAFTVDGWFDTGDVGFLHDGKLVLTGRAKEVIIVNGTNVSASEVEGVVESLSLVEPSFTCACAVKDGSDLEQLAVFFSPTAGIDEATLLTTIRREVAEQVGITPSYLVPLDQSQIPKTPIGKIQRSRLVGSFTDGVYADIIERIDLSLGGERTIPGWFHEVEWIPHQLVSGEPLGEALTDRHIGLSGGRHELATELHRTAEAAGASVHRFAPSDDMSTDGAEQLDHLVHISTTNDPRREIADLRRIGRLVIAASGSGVRCLVLVPDAPSVREVWAVLAQSWSQEVAGLDVTVVGIDSDGAPSADILLAELITPVRQPIVQFSEGRRIVPRIRAIDLPRSAADAAPAIRADAFYVVTGGLGGVGSEVVSWLLDAHSANVLIIGRRTRAELDDTPVAGRLAAFERRSVGVLYRSADVSSYESIRAAVNEGADAFGLPLGGVFHLAGGYVERAVHELSDADLDLLLPAKVDGAAHLARLLADQGEQGLLVAFSSAATLAGGALIGGYGAANALLESTCAQIAAEYADTLDVRCYSWTSWRGLGMSANADYTEVLREKGQHAISTQAGILSLAALLDRGIPTCYVGLDDTKPAISSRVNRARPAQRAACAVVAADASAPSAVTVSDPFGTPAVVPVTSLEEMPLTESGDVDVGQLDRLVSGRSNRVGPRDDVERELVHIWRGLLEAEDFGVTDSFFELGGNSLMAIQLFTRVEQSFGADLPLATLFEAPTIELLAALLDGRAASGADSSAGGTEATEWSPLVPIRRGNGSRPFFCVHGGGGNVLIFSDLVDRLNSEQTIYGLQAQGVDGRRWPLDSIDEMADLYLRSIREVQPEGPYRLGGYSGGGLVAHRMAQTLRQDGEDVAFLAMFDTFHPSMHNSRITLGARLRDIRAEGPAEYVRMRVRRRHRRSDRARASREQAAGPGVIPLEEREKIILHTFRRAGDAYVPAHYDGTVHMFLAQERRSKHRTPPKGLGWADHVADLQIISVPGNHDDMLGAPHVGELAAELQARLDAAG